MRGRGTSEPAAVLHPQLCLLLHDLEQQHQQWLFICVIAMLLPDAAAVTPPAAMTFVSGAHSAAVIAALCCRVCLMSNYCTFICRSPRTIIHVIGAPDCCCH